MYVVSVSSYNKRLAIQCFTGSTQVLVKGLFEGWFDQRLAVLGAEDDVDVVFD